ncbi:MAG: hypothetical protein H6978_10910 [Gammaproteobacteria bacterium]|nr:hypothetical protein [Gammaproteobacteria bacterium]
MTAVSSVSLKELCNDLFERGLGEFPAMARDAERVILGNFVKEKGQVVLRDRGLLKGISPASVSPCWDIGIIGSLCFLPGQEWESLSFVGADLCHIPVDLSSTRTDLLGRMRANSGETAITFKGSAYRGFKLLLDGHLLPVVLPLPVEVRSGGLGLAVCDFRYAATPLSVLSQINDLVMGAIERHLTVSVENLEIENMEFEKLFGTYIGATGT